MGTPMSTIPSNIWDRQVVKNPSRKAWILMLNKIKSHSSNPTVLSRDRRVLLWMCQVCWCCAKKTADLGANEPSGGQRLLVANLCSLSGWLLCDICPCTTSDSAPGALVWFCSTRGEQRCVAFWNFSLGMNTSSFEVGLFNLNRVFWCFKRVTWCGIGCLEFFDRQIVWLRSVGCDSISVRVRYLHFDCSHCWVRIQVSG